MHGRLRRIRLNISFLVMVFLLVALLLAVVFFFVFSFVRRILFVLLLCLFISLFFFYFLVGFNIMGRCKSFFFFLCSCNTNTATLSALFYTNKTKNNHIFQCCARYWNQLFVHSLLFIYFSYSYFLFILLILGYCLVHLLDERL